jgi:circadian clock protein KaiB
MHSSPIELLLFVVGRTPRSMLAIENLMAALAERPERMFSLAIIDVVEAPERALADRVLVTPTLLAPLVARRLVGDLSEAKLLRYFLETLPAA